MELAVTAVALVMAARRWRRGDERRASVICVPAYLINGVLAFSLAADRAHAWLVLVGFACVAAVLGVWFGSIFRRSRGDDDSGEGGGGGGRRRPGGPRPLPGGGDDEPPWWPEFERDLRDYVARRSAPTVPPAAR